MKKIYVFILFILLVCTSCGQQDLTGNTDKNNISLKLFIPQGFTTRVIDDDNLAIEQLINNISIFFVDTVTSDITYKFVHTAFVLSGEYQLISLPLEAADLQTKNIYAIANYDNAANLESLTNLTGLIALVTPSVDKNNNLDPLNGFCMSGTLYNFDFVNSGDAIATIPLTRSCAKIRVSLYFPDDPTLSTDNSFLIQNAANYTFTFSNPRAITSTGYFNFAAPIILYPDEVQEYKNIAYIYESLRVPSITFYTHINGSVEVQEFTASLPLPVRNYLYDIVVSVYEDEESNTRSANSNNKYLFESKIRVYNEKGEFIEEL